MMMNKENSKRGFSGLLSLASGAGEATRERNKNEHPQRPRKSVTKPGSALLLLAAWLGRAEEIKTLLSAGAQLDARDEDGRTPFDIAVRQGHTEEIKQLLSTGDQLSGQRAKQRRAKTATRQRSQGQVSARTPVSVPAGKLLRSQGGISLVFQLLARLFVPGVLFLLVSYCSQQDSDKTSTASSYTQPSPSAHYSPSQTLESQVSGLELEFSEPPVGDDNILSIAQIRWCLREEIRIEALRPILTTDLQIDQFNLVVDNYNRRCSSFQYRKGTLARAQQELEKMRAQIVAEASLFRESP